MLRRVKRMRRIRRDVAESANNAAHRMKANGNDVAAAGSRIQDPDYGIRRKHTEGREDNTVEEAS